MIKIYNIMNNIAPPFMTHLFSFRENVHDIWNFQILSNSIHKKVRSGLETVLYLSYGQIYHKTTNLKLLYMPSKQK